MFSDVGMRAAFHNLTTVIIINITIIVVIIAFIISWGNAKETASEYEGDNEIEHTTRSIRENDLPESLQKRIARRRVERARTWNNIYDR